MSSHVRILGIAGSLRRGSYNQAALRAAKLLVPESSEINLFQLADIPMFNEDDEKRPPSSVLELKKRIRRADALLIVTPEYNYSIPGVLKNALDWACRPQGDSAWSGKAAAIMGEPRSHRNQRHHRLSRRGEEPWRHIAGTGVGRRDDAVRTLRRMETLRRTRWVDPNFIAIGYAAIGDKDHALAWLETGAKERAYVTRLLAGWDNV